MLTLSYGSGLLVIKADEFLVCYQNNYFSIVCNDVHFSHFTRSVLPRVITEVPFVLLSVEDRSSTRLSKCKFLPSE